MSGQKTKTTFLVGRHFHRPRSGLRNGTVLRDFRGLDSWELVIRLCSGVLSSGEWEREKEQAFWGHSVMTYM